MRAMVMTAFGGPEVLEQRELPKPLPGPTEVLVKVHATSVNPVDYQTRRGDYREGMELPFVLGLDVSGVVEAVGEAVTDFDVGEEVYYMPRMFVRPGSYAEYQVSDESIIARKPANLSHFEAASLPLVGGTAWECLVTRGRLQVGESVLIHAGAGGIGTFAIQLAKATGAYVFATASARNADLPKLLGADRVIDYQNEDYVEVINRETSGAGVDLVLDTVGGRTIERSAYVLKPFGRVSTIVDITNPQSMLEMWNRNATLSFIFTPVYRSKLDVIRGLVERGLVKPVIDSVMPLSEVAEAHRRLEGGGVRGKIVLDTSA